MKNVIKKVSALAMVFTILGAGSAITQRFVPQLGNSIVASAATYSIDAAGIAFIKQFEGLRLVAYKVQESDPYYTIGYGHYGPDVYAGMVITEAEAVELLKKDLVKYEQKVNKQISELIQSQSQYNALVSLCYNTGGGNSIISNSPLGKFLKGEYSEKTAREKYASYYVTSNGKKLKGLVNRRNAEAELFFSKAEYNDEMLSDMVYPFTDVKITDWFAGAVKFVYNNKIMTGTSANTFSPNNELTREQFVTVLFNMADDPQKYYNAFDNCYTDVEKDKWYTTPIMWAHHCEIASGYGSKFGVGDKITREQFVTMLYNYETIFKKRSCNAPANALDKFSDSNKVSSWALTPMRWAVSQGIVSGKGNNKLAPNDTATRAECAQIIYKYSGNSSIYIIKSSNGAKVRNSASSSGTQIGALAKGSVVTYDQAVTANGYTWYHIVSVDAKNGSWGNYSGWVANV